MPPPDPHEVLGALQRLIAGLIQTKPGLSNDIATVSEWVARLARECATNALPIAANPTSQETKSADTSPTPDIVVRAGQTPVAPAPALIRGPVQKSAIVPLRIGDMQIHVPVLGSTIEIGLARQSAAHFHAQTDHADFAPAAEPDLTLIAKRCALKATSCDVVLRRHLAVAGSAEEAELVSEINSMIAQAKSLPTCFLWAPYRQAVLPSEEIIFQSARAYENLSLIAALTERIHTDAALRRHLPDTLELFAEAQNALRVILDRTWLTRPDQDQLDAFIWISRLTRAEQIYVNRFLRLDDPADPADHARLNEAINTLQTKIDTASKRSKGTIAAINKLKYHVAHTGSSPDEAELAGLRAAGDALSRQEIEPEDKRIREIIAPLAPLGRSGADIGEYLSRALRAADARASESPAQPPEQRVYSPGVERVRDMLRGSVVVLAGGEPYAHARDRLIEAFALGDLDWCFQTEHGSSNVFESPIARPETRLVLVLVKLAGHQHIDDIRRWCRAYSKPMVMLTAGYNPEQVAAAVLEQAADRLNV